MRLIEVQDVRQCALPLLLRAGDLLLFHATGGRILSRSGVVEMLGPFNQGLVSPDGSVLTPMGAPNVVLVRARQAGRATIEVITGDPWHAAETTTLHLEVEP
jgi:hypothetical protein